jgi:DNA modification methylase
VVTVSNNGTDRSWVNDIHQGDAAETLAKMPESSVHMAMTSPPYFGLRDYGVDGQIGLEDSLDEYIGELLNVAGELRRILRPDGSWWLNLGDSFAGSWGAQSKDDEASHRDRDAYPGKNPARNGTLRRKSKMLVPHRVAIALEDAGWIVRADCPWAKPNPMPHPVKDRLHEHKEFVFHLTPEPDYWFDLDAVREPHKEESLQRRGRYDYNTSGTDADADPDQQHAAEEFIGTEPEDALHPNGKNPGDVFEIPVKAFPEAHFAVYPPELCETPIKSSCPPKVCAVCGTPYGFETSDADLLKNPNDRDKKARALELYERSSLTRDHLEAARDVGLHDEEISNHDSDGGYGKVDEETARLAQEARDVLGAYTREFFTGERERTGWVQVCDCDTDDTEPGIVLDPFAGAGTTCMVAKDLGRRFIGLDLNPDYVALAQKRAGVTVDEPGRLLEDEAQTTLVQTGGGCNGRSVDTDTEREGQP